MSGYDAWKTTEPDPFADDERPEEIVLCPWCKVRMDDDHHPDCPNFQPLLMPCDEVA